MSAMFQPVCRLFPRVSSVVGRRNFFIYTPNALTPQVDREPTWKKAEDAVQAIESGFKVFVHGCAATPNYLLEHLANHGKKAGLKDVQLIHIPTVGPALYNNPEYEGIFRSNSLFIGANCREAIAEGRADTVPIFLSEIPLLFDRKIYKLDVALIHVSPPDQHGFCSLGTSVDCTRAAVQHAKYIIAQVNKQMPRTLGDSLIHMSHIDCMVENDAPLPEIAPMIRTPEINEIARLIADNLVEDGATLQTGIGNLPDAVLHKLYNHKDLGFHSEMISDTVVNLVEKGALTNAKKNIQTGKIVCSFAMGTKKLYSFLDDNCFVAFHECDFTNNISLISQNPRVTAINTCLEIDLTGQVCSDSIGTKMYSGFGGQIDFMRGAALSLDGEGKPIIACTSTTEDGISRIVPMLKDGAGVVTTRAHVHYIVTEYGIAFLFGKNLRQRAYELIKIAHPNERENLEKAAFERFKCMPSP
ncbi:4-hydroxybutyrate coenzyme A transferase-like [Mya arenaria]|uniref:4-hydroxybutyrate coenzyme A transferase-like n=1 Tax=Mya arenaria TaxID=6604 RepID=UPI0022E737A9|nr:4-hydroxybutyrate coenzyme A transferase-like [Mya arenaria]